MTKLSVGTIFPSLKKSALLMLVLIGLLFSQAAAAEPLRILDANNLLRAVTDAKSEKRVEVQIAEILPDLSIYRLSNVDGLKSDILGIPEQDILVFDKVSAGTWKLRAPNGDQVLQVQIKSSTALSP